MKYYDTDGTGAITYDEFVCGLKDPLTARRQNMVDKAFAILDKKNEGKITVQDIIGIYDVSMNPDYIEGKKTKE